MMRLIRRYLLIFLFSPICIQAATIDHTSNTSVSIFDSFQNNAINRHSIIIPEDGVLTLTTDSQVTISLANENNAALIDLDSFPNNETFKKFIEAGEYNIITRNKTRRIPLFYRIESNFNPKADNDDEGQSLTHPSNQTIELQNSSSIEFHGSLTEDDIDVISFTVPNYNSNSISISTFGGGLHENDIAYNLYDNEGILIAKKSRDLVHPAVSFTRTINFLDLDLNEGTYFLEVAGDEEDDYSLRFESNFPPADNKESVTGKVTFTKFDKGNSSIRTIYRELDKKKNNRTIELSGYYGNEKLIYLRGKNRSEHPFSAVLDLDDLLRFSKQSSIINPFMKTNNSLKPSAQIKISLGKCDENSLSLSANNFFSHASFSIANITFKTVNNSVTQVIGNFYALTRHERGGNCRKADTSKIIAQGRFSFKFTDLQ